MRIGLPEILVIALVIVLFVNPRQLPGLFRKAGRLVQQIKGMRESFVRGMNEIEHETRIPAMPARSDTTPPVPRAGTQSLPIQRSVHDQLSPAARTSIHLCVSTGLGDRIVFQGIIRHAMEKGGPDARVVAVVYDVGSRYFAKDYRPLPHEIWTIPRPAHPAASEDGLARRVLELASSLFPESVLLKVFDYRIQDRKEEPNPAIVHTELYSYYYDSVAPKGIYPRFFVDPEVLAATRRKLTRDVGDISVKPLVALHCRQRESQPEKNPRTSDMRALAEALKKQGALLVLSPDREGPDLALEALCDYTCPFDLTLQEPASILTLCKAFVGGDSGPAHLAAAVNIPVVSLRHPRVPWVNGPYCPGGRVAPVQGRIVEEEGRIALSFDVDAALACAVEFLSAETVPRGQAGMNGPGRSGS